MLICPCVKRVQPKIKQIEVVVSLVRLVLADVICCPVDQKLGNFKVVLL
jgi:hypothetical protein